MSSQRFCDTFRNMIVLLSRVSKNDFFLLQYLSLFVVINILPAFASGEDTEGSFEANLENIELTPDAEGFGELPEDDRMKLVQLDPVKVGFVRQMELEPEKFYDVETVAMKPPVFLIENLLTTEECERIKERALAKGLHSSKTVLTRPFNKSIEEVVDPYYNKTTFTTFDENKDNLLNITEAANALAIIKGVKSVPVEVFQYILEKFIDVDANGWIDDLEFRSIRSWETSITEWIDRYERNMTDPVDIERMKKGRSRVSKQAWLDHFSYDQNGNIASRIIALTGLHPDIIVTSENLQVVHYTPGGRYHAHFDSGHLSNEEPCEHSRSLYPTDPTGHLRTRRMCRFMTILYYLENTEEGGETAFPAADNETYYGEIYWKDNRRIDPLDLRNHCHDANLVVKPKKGMAVMWYNHYIDPQTEWLGENDPFSVHGGCDVIKGEKWIANNWITVDNNYEKQMEFHEKVFRELEESENVDSAMQVTNSEQDYKENQFPVAEENLANGGKRAMQFITDEGDTNDQRDQSHTEL